MSTGRGYVYSLNKRLSYINMAQTATRAAQISYFKEVVF
jgi:hypothetical protein